ncbi:unnamed protein product [Rotaria sp. Silwood1]|nr:unnamed protein product [Rotaria sp. Silwood1]
MFCVSIYRVGFADSSLDDQLTSLELIFFDIEYFFCFYIYDVGWWPVNSSSSTRCLLRYRDTKQKFSHLVNAEKYASGFFRNWYRYNWRFFDKNAEENKFLRNQIVYPSRFYYYAAFIEDVIFLHIWAINVFRQFRRFSAEYIDIIGFIFSLTEIFRRFIWNYFRLENEHLINCGEFRAVRDISIAPLSTAVDHATSENMIDKEMGIKNRKKMLDRIESTYIGIGLALRVFLFFQTRIKNDFEDNAEFVTPLNSWERIIEGIYLRKFNLSLFVGSIIHEVCKGI